MVQGVAWGEGGDVPQLTLEYVVRRLVKLASPRNFLI